MSRTPDASTPASTASKQFFSQGVCADLTRIDELLRSRAPPLDPYSKLVNRLSRVSTHVGDKESCLIDAVSVNTKALKRHIKKCQQGKHTRMMIWNASPSDAQGLFSESTVSTALETGEFNGDGETCKLVVWMVLLKRKCVLAKGWCDIINAQTSQASMNFSLPA